MNRRRLTSVVAAFALLLSCAPLTMLYQGLFEWFIPAALVVFAVVGSSLGTRTLRDNVLLPELAMFTALLLVCTWLYGSGTGLGGVIPGPDTLTRFADLVGEAGTDIRQSTIPAPPSEGLVFLLVVSMGSLAILSEVFVSLMRTPSLVGIPLFALYLVPALLTPVSVPWLLFIPGAVGYLWLLLTDNIDRVRRYGRRFSADGRGIDRWEPSPLSSTGRWLAAVVIPIALLLPAALPGFGTGMWDSINGMGDNSGSQGGSRVAPWASLEGALDTSETTELGFVETDANEPGYMKMWSASLLNEDGFKADTQPSEQAQPVTSGIVNPPPPDDVETTRSNATFRSTGLNDSALPLYRDISEIDVSDEWAFDPVAGTVTSESQATKDLSFQYSFVQTHPTPDQLRSLGEVHRSDVYRSFSETPDSGKVTDLVQQLTADAETSYDKVMAIQNHFSKDNGFVYDLRPSDDGNGSAIESFLRNKRGYCQQYAAAMGWMVREAGVASRVAIGLTEGERTGNGYRLTNFNFHAWVEVYFDSYGWVPFDPTPSSGVDDATEFDWAPDPNNPDSDPEGGGSDAGPDQGEEDDSSTGEGDSSEPRPEDDAEVVGPALSGVRPAPVWPYLAAGASVTALIILTPATARVWRRRRRMRGGTSPQHEAEEAWQEFRDSLRDLNVTVRPSDTPRVLAERVVTDGGLAGDAAAGVRHLAAAAEHAGYSPRPPGQLSLPLASRAARYGTAASRSRWQQVRADLLPPSTLSDWFGGLRRRISATRNAMLRTRLGAGRRARHMLAAARRRTSAKP